MKHLITLIIAGFLLYSINPQNSYTQSSKLNPKVSKDIKKGPVKISKKEVLNKISKNTKSHKKDLRGTWQLEEDFESGIVPPDNWSSEGNWDAYNVSAYGIGNYSAFYEIYYCPPNYALTTPNIIPSGGDDTLIFDIAYAGYLDGEDSASYTDAMTIYYSTDDGNTYFTLIYLPGDSMKTAPATNAYFVPENTQWKSLRFGLPAGTNRVQFYPESGCANNLFLDNIRVGQINESYDASVDLVWAKGKMPLVYGVPDNIPVLIKNQGASTILNLKVYLNISGTSNLTDSIVIPAIGPGDTMQVDFLGFNPVLNGFSDVTVTIPDDDNNGNNSKTFLSEVNPNTIRYVDSNCCNSGVGWVGEYSFLNKYYMSGTGQIRKVNIKIGQNNENQFVYGYVVGSDGNVLGKSPNYKIQATDGGKYVSFDITDPKHPIVTDSYYYVGIAQTEYAGDGFAFTPQELAYEIPARPDANYYAPLAPAGTNVGAYEFPREYGQNYAIEAVLGDQSAIDAGVSDLGPVYDQYFNSATYSPAGKVFNAGTGSATFTVNRKITPGGYSSTISVTGLAAGGNAIVTFDPWTFTSGTNYTVRDSVVLAGDGNISNNVKSNTITPRIAKQLCVLWQQQQDKDSLVRAINADGRYANNFDTVRMNYTGSFRSWKIMFVNFKEQASYSQWVRDSLKMFIDNSTAGNKKTLVVFGDAIANVNDPLTGYPSPADSVFYRQYLKSMTISENWVANIPSSQSRFRGIGFFDGITQDSVSDPHIPDLIKPANGSSAAFKPQSVTGNGSDSCIAVSFAGTNYNTFFMSNQFSGLRSTGGSPSLNIMGPVRVYTKIIDWLQSVNTGAKVMDLTAKLEGFYNQGTNYMVSDTMRIYLRSSVNPFPKVDSAKSFLNSAGQASFVFNNASNGTQYYIQLKHRNGLETWSKTTQSFSSNHLAYNFTTDSAKAFGNNMKKQGSSWVLFTGDVNQDGFIDLTDVVQTYNAASAFVSGYAKTDVNGDGFSDLTDIVITYNNAVKFVQKSIPLSEPEILAQNENDQNIFNQNSAAQNTDYINGEIRIDHEIYERFKNEKPNQINLPDLNIVDNLNRKSVIKGSSIKRMNK